MKELKSVMAHRLKVDYPNFNSGFFARRVCYMFEKMGFHRPDDLVQALNTLPMSDEITYYMSVPSTELFRAPEFWKQLMALISEFSGKPSFWFPCLSSYHDLYSLVIILHALGVKEFSIKVNVISDHIAQDIHSLNLSVRNNSVNEKNFEALGLNLSFADVARCEGLQSCLTLPLPLANISIENGWFMNTDDAKYDFIIFRNSLITYNHRLHEKAVNKLVDSLAKRNSCLCLGLMERPLFCLDRLDESLQSVGIYKFIR